MNQKKILNIACQLGKIKLVFTWNLSMGKIK